MSGKGGSGKGPMDLGREELLRRKRLFEAEAKEMQYQIEILTMSRDVEMNLDLYTPEREEGYDACLVVLYDKLTVSTMCGFMADAGLRKKGPGAEIWMERAFE